MRERKYVRKCLRRRSLGDVREGRENIREEARERSRGGEGTFARGRGNVCEGARERSRGGEGTFVRDKGTFVRDEGTFTRGDLQGHRTFQKNCLNYMYTRIIGQFHENNRIKN